MLAVLELAGAIEWARIGVGSHSPEAEAPLIVWRYVAEAPWLETALASAVREYVGAVLWVAERPGRNWILWPERQKLEFEAEGWKTDSAYRAALQATDPEFCARALEDLEGLLLSIEKRLKSAANAG